MQDRPLWLLIPDRDHETPLQGTSIEVYTGLGKWFLELNFWLENHFHGARNTSISFVCTHLASFTLQSIY